MEVFIGHLVDLEKYVLNAVKVLEEDIKNEIRNTRGIQALS